MRRDRLARLAVVLVASFGVAACGSSKVATVPAEGTVTYQGKSLEKGQVQFHPEAGPGPHDAWPMVQVDVDRVWGREAGVPRAAVVSARFE